jgi:nucleoside 2-deoxyribosyltransferase
MKIYIASKTSEREEVKRLNKIFKAKGFEVFDWTWHKNTKPYEKHKLLSTKYSLEDVKMVKNCDIFILLTNEISGSGSTTEFGMALLSYKLFKKPIMYIVGKHINNMFFFYPGVTLLKTTNELLSELKVI